MELTNGSDAFSAHCEALQVAQSPEDILIAIEELNHCSYHELGDEELDIQIAIVSKRTVVWQE
jgi:hypothetical protein